jgi:hypothetical protein
MECLKGPGLQEMRGCDGRWAAEQGRGVGIGIVEVERDLE